MSLTTHEITGADAQAMQAVRAALAAAPKLAFEPGAREEDIARFLAEHLGTQAEARA